MAYLCVARLQNYTFGHEPYFVTTEAHFEIKDSWMWDQFLIFIFIGHGYFYIGGILFYYFTKSNVLFALFCFDFQVPVRGLVI